MATSKDYLEFVLEQLAYTNGITHLAMMGEYILYYNGKVIGGIYDNRFLLKPCNATKKYMSNGNMEVPYEGAKLMYLVEDMENKEMLRDMIMEMYDELPMPKKKK